MLFAALWELLRITDTKLFCRHAVNSSLSFSIERLLWWCKQSSMHRSKQFLLDVFTNIVETIIAI